MSEVKITHHKTCSESINLSNDKFRARIEKRDNSVQSVRLWTATGHVFNLNIETKIIPFLEDLANICLVTVAYLKQNEEQNIRWY